MNYFIPLGPLTLSLVLGGLVFGVGGCRKDPSGVTNKSLTTPVVVDKALGVNSLATLPGAVYHSQAGSPIHWQPWTLETLDRAKSANRLIFAVIALPQQPGFQSVLDSLSKNQTLVSVIHENYVPVLIDGDASREMSLLAGDLCAEIKRGVQMPLFLWITPEGNPVAWTPASKSSPRDLAELFNQSHTMVSRMWNEDSGYVLKNSALDNQNRRSRFANRKNANVKSEQPAKDILRSLRQLASFYDPHSRSFDEAGGLFPSGSIDLLSTAAVHPGLPPEVRTRCQETVRELMLDILPSAMFDPLEGGVFNSRRGKSWALPNFSWDCGSQARAVVALIHAYRATGDTRVLEKALGLISFSEKSFLTSEGLFSVGLADESEPTAWLWTVEQVQKELPAADALWWIRATGMKDLGNLPSEADMAREYFRSNTLGLSQSLAEMATANGETVEAFTPRFEATRKTLLKARNARIGSAKRDNSSHAGSTFRMASAYAAAFGATGDVKYRDAAVALMDKARAAFSKGPELQLFSSDTPPSLGGGRAFLYGLALQASLDLSDITSDEKWLSWSEDLATTAAELFTGNDFLKECPDEGKILDLPVTDLVMLFDDSTAGLISLAECRLAERNRPLVQSFSKLATPIPIYIMDFPILHTDLLQATMARHYRVTVVAGEGITPEMKLAIQRLPLRMIQRRPAKSKDEVPPRSVMIIQENTEPRTITDPSMLREVLLPSLKNS